jgi:magnesium transporter
MGKELVKVNENWNVLTCVKEMRQAENVSSAFYLCGRWWKQTERKTFIKGLITSTKNIYDIYIRKLKLT